MDFQDLPYDALRVAMNDLLSLKDNKVAIKGCYTDEEEQQKLIMTSILYSSILLLSISTFSMGCPEGWLELNDSCYLVTPRTANWHEAQGDCRERGKQ